jgi:hypothetical protein
MLNFVRTPGLENPVENGERKAFETRNYSSERLHSVTCPDRMNGKCHDLHRVEMSTEGATLVGAAVSLSGSLSSHFH